MTNITNFKRTEQALRVSEERFRRLSDISTEGIFILSEGKIVDVNRAGIGMLGYTEDELIGLSALDITDSSVHGMVQEKTEADFEGTYESKARRKDGTTFPVMVSASMYDAGGRRHRVACLRDISETKAAEEALIKSEERYRSILENMTDGFYRVDFEGRVIMASKSGPEALGYSVDDLIGTSLTGLYVEENGREKFLVALEEGGGKITGHEAKLRHRDGHEVWVSSSAHYVRDTDGKIVGIEGTMRDITGRKRAEEALRESERKAAEAQDLLMDAIESSPDGIAIYDTDDRLVVFNDKFRTGVLKGIADIVNVGVTYEELLRAAVDRGLTKIRDGDVEQYIEKRLAHHRGGEGSMEIELSNDRWMLAQERRMRSGGIVGTRADITEVKRAEKALRESEERFRAVVDNSPAALLLKDSEGRFRMMNRRFQEWFGFGDDAIGKTTQDLYPNEFAETLLAQDDEVLATGRPLEQEYEATFADGSKRKVVLTKFPVIGSGGETIGIGSVGIDVTEQRRTEEQLNQAQKMEAVGQLTGGVAHDFNNLLAIIRGNLELVEDTAGVDAETIRNVAHAMRATDRAADLTQRLLAFSRRQTLQPKVVDLNDLVGTMGELLRRTLGETIEVRTVAASPLWPCEVDPAQMENALLNLAINARDAMADGGKLTIETSNVRLDDDYAAAQVDVVPGKYVQLAVSDTGVGMLPDVADRAFEPFFTTKDVGKGSGLGLSMIYGFVKQSGGYVRIYSEEGKGTTVKIYLPRCQKDGSGAAIEDQKHESPMGRGETVLVVEDDPDVRTLAVILLQNLGYRTEDARTGQDALALLDNLPRIDLMLTDVVLPGGMNGRELSDTVRDRYPGLPVVFMSGYTQDAVIHHGRLDDGIELLQKPFRKHELAAKVQNALKR